MLKTNRIRMKAKPAQGLSRDDFTVETISFESPASGEVLVAARYFSLDPYLTGFMRGWQGPDPRWSQGIVVGRFVAEVIESQDQRFAVGDWVQGEGGWQESEVISADKLQKIESIPGVPFSVYLSVLGSSGLTAWAGVNGVLKVQAGETFTVSSAAGMVGGIAGQIAKKLGARVIGIAGGAEKCAHVVNNLGFDACVDHHSNDLQADLAAAAGSPITAHFENVGAKTLDPVLANIADRGRIALCGLIAHYQDMNPIALKEFRRLLISGVSLRGFRLPDFAADFQQATTELKAMVISGDISVTETISHGIASAPDAYLNMLEGKGVGKHLLKVG